MADALRTPLEAGSEGSIDKDPPRVRRGLEMPWLRKGFKALARREGDSGTWDVDGEDPFTVVVVVGRPVDGELRRIGDVFAWKEETDEVSLMTDVVGL